MIVLWNPLLFLSQVGDVADFGLIKFWHIHYFSVQSTVAFVPAFQTVPHDKRNVPWSQPWGQQHHLRCPVPEQRQRKIYSLVGGSMYDVSHFYGKPLVWGRDKIPSSWIAPSDHNQGVFVGIFDHGCHCVIQDVCISVARNAAVVQRLTKMFGHDRALWAHLRSVA